MRTLQLNPDDRQGTARTAVGLAKALSRLRNRLREEAGMHSIGLSISQLALLGRIIEDAPTTAASLAGAEHVSQQAIAQSLATLKAEGLVVKRHDPSDGRKTLIEPTPEGRRLHDSMFESREAWLIRAIEATVPDDERAALEHAIELLERLAAADLRPRAEIR
ncbi:MAG TPA: MarR family transcriptional regulator [Solirubrobacteraceae bacterium]|nr:MarR family transcriptional regulator [Solirubrobacteraceae bacterium]